MRYIALFAWLLVPLALWGSVTFWGTPHLVISYSFLDNGDRYNPVAERHYVSCTYLSWSGQRSVHALDGKCPWLRAFRGVQ